MKTIGVIGGMSWVSSADYYRHLNEEVARRLGGLHSARVLMLSVDFAQVERLQEQGRWDESGQLLAAAARNLQSGGADCVLLATNTMHLVAEQVAAAVDIPFLHIADALAAALRADGVDCLGLLGTAYTMQPGIYHQRLQGHGIRVLTPPQPQREELHRIIYEELCHNRVEEAARRAMAETVQGLADAGAQGVALACTELHMIAAPDPAVPLYDTGVIHCRAAADFALGE